MSDVTKTEQLGEITNGYAFDLLGRESFIQQIIEVMDTLSANKRGACYAINGGWGVGKTWVLDALEKKIQASQSGEAKDSQYLIFRYDCWKYDFYEEPLIALVAAILDEIDNRARVIPEEVAIRVKNALKATALKALDIVNTVIDKKIGVNIKESIAPLIDSQAKATKDLADAHVYDSYFEFKKVLQDLTTEIQSLAKDKTLVFIVDELDRCLPEYTIKILERLHHLFYGIPNVQVILSVDKAQLGNTINRIYGSETSVEKYLAKIIDFEMSLDVGESQHIVRTAYPDYYTSFTKTIFPQEDIDNFCTTLFQGIDMRTRKAIIRKSFLCHQLLKSDQPEMEEASILCIELFLTLLREYKLNTKKAKECRVVAGDSFHQELFGKAIPQIVGLNNLYKDGGRKYLEFVRSGGSVVSEEVFYNRDSETEFLPPRAIVYVRIDSLLGFVFGCYRWILGFADDNFKGLNNPFFPIDYRAYQQYALKFWQFSKLIN